jgi:hypothetical protein
MVRDMIESDMHFEYFELIGGQGNDGGTFKSRRQKSGIRWGIGMDHGFVCGWRCMNDTYNKSGVNHETPTLYSRTEHGGASL